MNTLTPNGREIVAALWEFYKSLNSLEDRMSKKGGAGKPGPSTGSKPAGMSKPPGGGTKMTGGGGKGGSGGGGRCR